MSLNAFVKDIVAVLKDNRAMTKSEIARLKIQLSKKHSLKRIPTDIELYLNAPKESLSWLREILQTKPNSSLSGVAPLAIMTSPHQCPHGKCRMCPGGVQGEWGDTPQSYTGSEPAALRGARAGFDAFRQVFNRLEQYVVTGHSFDKIDLIIMGGTFPARTKEYQQEFVMRAFQAMNIFSTLFFDSNGVFNIDSFKTFFELPGDINNPERAQRIQQRMDSLQEKTTLQAEQERNEQANVRCVGLTIETRPDWGLEEHGNQMLDLGCTRVELGIQSVYDKALSAITRGHDTACNKRSIADLKDLGFKLNFHMMMGLPTVSEQEDIEGLNTLFSDSDYQPDMLKLYPCMVMPGTKLKEDYDNGTYTPITTKQAAKIIGEFLAVVPSYCRVMRVQRDIPTYKVCAGVDRTNLRQYVNTYMKEQGLESDDIRAREAGRKTVHNPKRAQLSEQHYLASGGEEYFISIDDSQSNTLYGFCRLRFPARALRKEFTPTTAIIRELHVYGSAQRIGSFENSSTQHHGFGKQLLKRAEELARQQGRDKILVISGVGVREYYAKQGYYKEGPYMAKEFSETNKK
ncbi:MAG: tRNA uridine(34) 5-carboxymethylaminomethyl modification radical SAM/GNAT enzyme Elp3 [Nanobdellota archaeon]